MYPAHLGQGMTIDLDPAPATGADVLYSHEYVAKRGKRPRPSREDVEQRYPLLLTEETNLYEYVGSSPLSRIDPSGLFALTTTCTCGRRAFAWDVFIVVPLGPSCTLTAMLGIEQAVCDTCCALPFTCWGSSGPLLGQCMKWGMATTGYDLYDCFVLPDLSPLG